MSHGGHTATEFAPYKTLAFGAVGGMSYTYSHCENDGQCVVLRDVGGLVVDAGGRYHG